MSKALVLGCGNIQRGDDGVAFHVLNYLRKALGNPPEFIFQQQLTPELAEPISQAETVIFVDADAGTTPGSITCRELKPGAGKSCTHSHLTSIESLLLAAEQLYGAHPERAYLVTIAGASANTQADLGHEIDAAVSWSPWEPLTLVGGYSALILGDGARNLLAAVPAQAPSVSSYAYLQAALRVP